MQLDAAILSPIILSAKLAASTLPLFLIFGVGIGYIVGRRRTPAAIALDFIVTLPLVFPPIATGFLLLLLLGRAGPLGEPLRAAFGLEIIFSFWGVMLAAFIAGLPLMVKAVQASIRADTLRLMEISAVLGKSPLETFLRITLPSIRKSIATGLFMAQARALGEVGVTLKHRGPDQHHLPGNLQFRIHRRIPQCGHSGGHSRSNVDQHSAFDASGGP